jgi:hypothetical protein
MVEPPIDSSTAPTAGAANTRILTEKKVRRLRESSERSRSRRELAAEYGVATGTISNVIGGHTWKHV